MAHTDRPFVWRSSAKSDFLTSSFPPPVTGHRDFSIVFCSTYINHVLLLSLHFDRRELHFVISFQFSNRFHVRSISRRQVEPRFRWFRQFSTTRTVQFPSTRLITTTRRRKIYSRTPLSRILVTPPPWAKTLPLSKLATAYVHQVKKNHHHHQDPSYLPKAFTFFKTPIKFWTSFFFLHHVLTLSANLLSRLFIPAIWPPSRREIELTRIAYGIWMGWAWLRGILSSIVLTHIAMYLWSVTGHSMRYLTLRIVI